MLATMLQVFAILYMFYHVLIVVLHANKQFVEPFDSDIYCFLVHDWHHVLALSALQNPSEGALKVSYN